MKRELCYHLTTEQSLELEYKDEKEVSRKGEISLDKSQTSNIFSVRLIF